MQPTAHLFVYGTLMPQARGYGAAARNRLRDASRCIGPATLPGRLISLGRYPGFIAAPAEGDRVHGQLLELNQPSTVWPWLDAFEGVGAGQPYVREIREAAQTDGTRLPAWVYRYTRDAGGLPVIAGGRWPAGHPAGHHAEPPHR